MKTSVVFSTLLATAALAPLAYAQFGWAVTTDSKLIHFSLSNPSTTLLSNSLTGLRQSNGVTPDPFGNILDLAQFNGQLYGLDGNANFYSIAYSGAATFISNSFAPLGFDAGLAYDPFASKFRFVSDAGENALIATNGAVSTGANIFYASTDANAAASAFFTGLAIDYDFGTGFALDSELNTLATTVDTHFAEFFTVGSLGLDITSLSTMDILNGSLYAALSTDASSSNLYTIDALTGSATLIGGFNTGITGLAVTASSSIPTTSAVPEPSSYAAFAGGITLTLALFRRRFTRTSRRVLPDVTSQS